MTGEDDGQSAPCCQCPTWPQNPCLLLLQEYTTQTGFGWSNGVALDLLQTYGWEPEHANISEPTVATTAEEANVLPGTASS